MEFVRGRVESQALVISDAEFWVSATKPLTTKTYITEDMQAIFLIFRNAGKQNEVYRFTNSYSQFCAPQGALCSSID
jgi:hypothetical protein